MSENKYKSAFGYGFANEQSHQEETGLSKREYFAAMAMQGMLSNSSLVLPNKYKGNAKEQYEIFSAIAIDYADSLLEQLDKTN